MTLPGGKKTPHNLNCTANYVLGTCSKVKLQCSFKMKGSGVGCSRGDRATLTYGSKTITSVVFLFFFLLLNLHQNMWPKREG